MCFRTRSSAFERDAPLKSTIVRRVLLSTTETSDRAPNASILYRRPVFRKSLIDDCVAFDIDHLAAKHGVSQSLPLRR
jgi:hypothetical protein